MQRSIFGAAPQAVKNVSTPLKMLSTFPALAALEHVGGLEPPGSLLDRGTSGPSLPTKSRNDRHIPLCIYGVGREIKISMPVRPINFDVPINAMGFVVTTCDEGLLLAVYPLYLKSTRVSLREDLIALINKLSSALMKIISRMTE